MKTGQIVAQTTTNGETVPTEPKSVDAASKPAPDSTTLSTGGTSATTAKISVAKVHEAKDIPSKTLWTAHSIGGALFLIAVLCIVFAKGPTRKQALAALMNESK